MIDVRKSLYASNNDSILNILLDVIIVIVAVFFIFEIVFSINYTGYYVIGESMNNTLNGAPDENSRGGDFLYIYKHDEPTYNDIVVVEKDDGKTIIKRVIALGGDRVKIINGQLWLKKSGEAEFTPIDEEYVTPSNNDGDGSQDIDFPLSHGVVVDAGHLVADGCLFLMGDNRDWSLDSRKEGDFPLSQLQGVVTDWSQNNKSFFSGVHNYFYYDLPRYFGFNKNK